MMQNTKTKHSNEEKQRRSWKGYRTDLGHFQTTNNDMPFHPPINLKPRADEIGSPCYPHLCSSRCPMEISQLPFSICSVSASLNSMPLQPMTSYGPQHRFYISNLEDDLPLCAGTKTNVHRPTPIYMTPVSFSLLPDEWAVNRETTTNTILKDNTECFSREKEHIFNEIGSGTLSAFSSRRKKNAQYSRKEEEITGFVDEAENVDKIQNDVPRQDGSSSKALDPDHADDQNTSSYTTCFDARLKIKEETLPSPTEYETNTNHKNLQAHENKFSYRLYGADQMSPQSVNGMPADENRSILVQTIDHDAASEPDKCEKQFDFTQDPSTTKFPLPEVESGVECDQQQKPKHSCNECGRSFTRSSTLVTHKRIHSGDKPFSCEVCGRAFRQPGNLSRHRLTHATTKPYVCPHCSKAFNRASNLHTHMRTHSDYKPYACDFCDKRFHQKVDMKIHRYTHTGEKPHKCSKCGRGFKQLTHLTYHMRTHSDVRMYQCEFCGKGFNQKGNLQAHRYRHTGERPFKCDVCGKGFTLASTRNTHLRTHADKKPFECQYCDKAFYQKNALKIHYIASHPYSGGVLIL